MRFINVKLYLFFILTLKIFFFKFDHLGWIPNGPLGLNKAPPTTKEQSSMEDILAYLPKKSSAILVMSSTWLFRGNFSDFVSILRYINHKTSNSTFSKISHSLA